MKKNTAITIFILISINTIFSKEIRSSNLNNEQKIEVIKNKIEVKSKILWVEFYLYDVNDGTRSIPGPSNKQYFIIMCVDKEDIKKWIYKKENWITLFPYNLDWLDKIETKKIMNLKALTYSIYDKEEFGYKYIMFVNEDNGIILIKYIEE